MADLTHTNQYSFRRLVRSIMASYGRLNLLIALCDNRQYRNQLIEDYEAELKATGTGCYRVQIDTRQPSLKQSLQSLFDKPAAGLNGHSMVTVLGADDLLGLRLNQDKSAQEKLFFSMQWTREALRQFDLPIVLWFKSDMATTIAQQAPDFWSWRGGVFEFHQPIAWNLTQSPKEVPKLASTEDPELTSVADPAELQRQIAALTAQDPDSPLLASLYNDLGKAHENAVRYSAAETAYRQALKLREVQLGSDHPSTATSLNNLALLYDLMGRYGEAEPLYVRALAIIEAQLGADHPSTATSLNNLAALYNLMGRYGEAEALSVRALAIIEAQLGANHPDTAMSLNNLAGLYYSMGRYGEAEPLYVRSLEIRETQLGSDHPDTALSLNNLASLYRSMGRYSEAEQL